MLLLLRGVRMLHCQQLVVSRRWTAVSVCPAWPSLGSWRTAAIQDYQARRPVSVSAALRAEPPKAKKKVDAVLQKVREERKKKKIERGIRRLERMFKIPKPVDNEEDDHRVMEEHMIRRREPMQLSEQEQDRRYEIQRTWDQLRTRQHNDDASFIHESMRLADVAADRLKQINLELYNLTLRRNDDLLGIIVLGPVENVGSSDYQPPEGDYIDRTNFFERGYGVSMLEAMKKEDRERRRKDAI